MGHCSFDLQARRSCPVAVKLGLDSCTRRWLQVNLVQSVLEVRSQDMSGALLRALPATAAPTLMERAVPHRLARLCCGLVL